VDFDAAELEKLIRSHGGQLLSSKIIEALKIDNAAAATTTAAASKKRKCYVVGWGGYMPSHLDIHPLLSQVKRNNLCDMQEVTPIWLYTCVTERKAITPSRLPILFSAANSRPIHLISAAPSKTDTKAPTKKTASSEKENPSPPPDIRISITGFSGSKRTAIMHLIKAMGATYDDSMRTSTTHLICEKGVAVGGSKKYDKAVEWKIRVVAVDWLYHVAQYGFDGKDSGNAKKKNKKNATDKGEDDAASNGIGGGCEHLFPVVAGDAAAGDASSFS